MASTNQKDKQPIKPKHVTYAVYLIYAAIALSFLFAVSYASADWQATLNTYTDPVELICFGFGYLISIYIAFMISSGRSWARALIIVDFLFSFLNGAGILEYYLVYPLPTALFVGSTFMRLTAIILLFQAPSNAWFKAVNERDKSIKGASDEPAVNPQEQLTPKGTAVDPAAEPEIQAIPAARYVAYAAAAGAAIGLMNAGLWAVTLPPETDSEQSLIIFLLLSGIVFGALFGAVSGFLFLQFARRSPARDPARWTIYGGIIGGTLSFICGFFFTALSFT